MPPLRRAAAIDLSGRVIAVAWESRSSPAIFRLSF